MRNRIAARPSSWATVLLAVASLIACSQSPTQSQPQSQTQTPGMLLWSGDFETGDLSQFMDTPWNTVGGPPPKIVQDPVHSGRYAVELALLGRTTPKDGICCGTRNEIEPLFREMVEGEDLWFGFSTYLDPNFPTYYSEWQVIMQFKQNFDGSPPLELTVEKGEFRIEGGYGYPDGPRQFIKTVGRAEKGRWIDWIMHVKFSPDPAVGYVEVWRGGELVLPRFTPPGGTMYVNPKDGSAAVSVKTGYYRDPSIDSVGRVYLDDWRIGTSRQVVLPPPQKGPSTGQTRAGS